MINEKLFKAVETGKADEVEKALTEEKINTATYYGAKSIVFAAKQENSDILKMLLKNGEKINRESFWRRAALPALLNAVRANNTETVKLMLEYGADIDKKTLNSPLLLYAINTENKEMETLLMEHGADISKRNPAIYNDTHNNTKKTKFCYEDSNDNETEIYTDCLKEKFLRASYEDDIEKVKFYLEKLIENVVGVLTDETGRSTLEIALENNPDDIIKILSNYGFHENALHYAYRCLLKI